MKSFKRRGMNFTPDNEELEEKLEAEDAMQKKALEGVVMLYAPSVEKKEDKEGCIPGESDAECNDRKKPKRGSY